MLRFVSIFADESAKNIGPAAAGLLRGSGSAVVVKLEEKNNLLVDEYFEAEGHAGADAQQAIRR